MDVTIRDTKAGTRTSIKAQLVATLGGLALAATALAALSGRNTSNGVVVEAVRPAASISAAGHASSPSQVAFYIAGDQSQIDMANFYEEHAQWVRYASGVPEPRRSVIVLKAATPTEAATAQNFINDVMGAAYFSDPSTAPIFTLVDLRGHRQSDLR